MGNDYPPSVNMSHRIGFTLLEIMVVLTIMVLIASLGIFALQGTLAQRELQSAADTIRGEWLNTQVTAMEEGQVFVMRANIGTNTIVIDRVLDTHFTAGLSSRLTTGRFDFDNQFDPFERGGFTGDVQDFVLPHPENTATDIDRKVIVLPRSVTIADVIAVADERAAFYLGFATPDELPVDEIFGIEEIRAGEVRMGEMSSSEGFRWSTPIFFYPDGTASTAAILLKNQAGRCIEVRLRGLTGTGSITETFLTENYTGELDANRF